MGAREPPICTVFEAFRLVLPCVHNEMICAWEVQEVADSENQITRWTMHSSRARVARPNPGDSGGIKPGPSQHEIDIPAGMSPAGKQLDRAKQA
jgi:hypothetical protein